MTPSPHRRRALLFALALASLAAAGCATVRLVGDYDQQIDESATRLQRAMDAQLTRLESLDATDPAGDYPASKQFYMDYAVDLRAMEARATGIEKNSRTVQQIQLMEQSLESLRKTHETGRHLSAGYIQSTRNLFNIAWTAVLTAELAKRRR